MKKHQCISMLVLAAGGVAAQTAGAPPDRVTIGQAVQEAVERNLNLLAERYNLSIADARIVTAKLRPNPVVSAGLDYVDFLRNFTHTTRAARPSTTSARISSWSAAPSASGASRSPGRRAKSRNCNC